MLLLQCYRNIFWRLGNPPMAPQFVSRNYGAPSYFR